MNHPIHPPAYDPSELEYRAAWLYYCLDRVTDDLMTIKIIDEDQVKSERDISLRAYHMNALMKLVGDDPVQDLPDEDLWSVIISFSKFKANYRNFLGDEHGGDCTAFPASCMRCHAEDLFRIPSTVTWNGKHEGYKLFHDWLSKGSP